MQPCGVESQGVALVPSTVQRTPPVAVGQLLTPHAPAAQVTSHAQASRQLMLPHAPVPMHATEQVEPFWHVTLSQALSPLQLIVQVQPLGQVTNPQVSALEHSAVQVFITSSHEVQSLGQFGTTQKPLVHWRLSGNPLQSAVVLHANCSDGRSTKQAANTAAPITAPSHAGFIR